MMTNVFDSSVPCWDRPGDSDDVMEDDNLGDNLSRSLASLLS